MHGGSSKTRFVARPLERRDKQHNDNTTATLPLTTGHTGKICVFLFALERRRVMFASDDDVVV